MIVRATAGVIVALLLVGTGCLFDASVPDDAQVSCEDHDDCPGDRRCAPTKLCVAPGTETTAPALEGNPALAPASARVGTVLSVALTPTEALDGLPVVTLTHDETGDVRALATTSTAAPFSFSYTVGALDAPGTWSGRVALVDLVGNAADVAIGSVVVDTRAPVLVSASEPAPTRVSLATTSVAVTLVFDEPLAQAPVLTSRHTSGATLVWPAIATDAPTTWRHELAGVASLLDGAHTFSVVATDAAENESTTALAITLDVDRTPPTPTLEVQGGVDEVRAPTAGHDEVRVDVDAGEVGADVTLVGGVCAPRGTTTWDCTYVVDGSEGDFVTLVVRVTDDAGNMSELDVTVPIDAHAPAAPAALTTITLTPGAQNPLAAVSAVAVDTAVEVAFQTDEPLGVTPALALGGASMEVVESAGTQHRARLVMRDGLLPDGGARIEATLEDALGNTHVVELGAVVIDTTAPDVLDDARNLALVYERDAASGALRCEGSAPVTEEDGHLIVESATGVELGRASASGAGCLADIALTNGALAWVYAVHVDAAGNRAAPARVRTVEYVEAFGRALDVRARSALRDDVADAPDALGFTGVWGTLPRAELLAFEKPASARALLRDDVRDELIAVAQDGAYRFDGARWRRAPLRVPPSTAQVVGAQGIAVRAVEDGGADPFVTETCVKGSCDPWTSHLTSYQRHWPSTRLDYVGDVATPTPTEGAWQGSTFLLDADGEVVRVGGTMLRTESWTVRMDAMFPFDPVHTVVDAAVDIVASADPPRARTYASAALDTDRGVIVVYGGLADARTRCATTGGTDPATCTLSYESNIDESEMTFIWWLWSSLDDEALTDTWERAPDGTWTQVIPTDPELDGNPPPMAGAFMHYDPVSGLTLLSDGFSWWGWNGASWTELAIGDAEDDGEPLGMPTAALFDETRGALVVAAQDDVYAFQGTSFTALGRRNIFQPGHGTLAVSPRDGATYLATGDVTDALWRLGAREWELVPTTDPEGDGNPGAGARVIGFDLASDPDIELAALDNSGAWVFANGSWRLVGDEPFAGAHLVDAGELLFAAHGDQAWWWNGSEWTTGPLLFAPHGDEVTPPVLVDVDAVGDGLAFTLEHPRGASVARAPQWPPPGEMEVFAASGVGRYLCDIQLCLIPDLDAPTCPYDSWMWSTPDVAVLGGEVVLWNAFDVSFSYDFYDGDILCMRPASDTQTLRVLGSSGTLPQNTALSLADPEADGTPSFQGLASVNDPTTGDVLFLESVSRVWRVHDGSNDIPAWMLYADPDDAALPLDAITSITVDASGNAPAGLALSRWDEPSRTWQRIGAGAGTADVTHEARDAASLDALWGERRDPLRIAVIPDDGVGPIELTSARVRTRYVLP